MKRQIIAIGGDPASGKSTLVKRFLKTQPEREAKEAGLVRYLQCSPTVRVLGCYEKGEAFPGTDKLSMGVQPVALEFVKTHTGTILFEGDRLFNLSFIKAVSLLPETEVKVLLLTVSPTTLARRHKERGDSQSEQFIKGRDTKYFKLKGALNMMKLIGRIHTIKQTPHETPEHTEYLLGLLKEWVS